MNEKPTQYRSGVIYGIGDMDWLIGRAAWDYIYFTVPDEKDPNTRVIYEDLEDAKNKTGFEEVELLDK